MSGRAVLGESVEKGSRCSVDRVLRVFKVSRQLRSTVFLWPQSAAGPAIFLPFCQPPQVFRPELMNNGAMFRGPRAAVPYASSRVLMPQGGRHRTMLRDKLASGKGRRLRQAPVHCSSASTAIETRHSTGSGSRRQEMRGACFSRANRSAVCVRVNANLRQ